MNTLKVTFILVYNRVFLQQALRKLLTPKLNRLSMDAYAPKKKIGEYMSVKYKHKHCGMTKRAGFDKFFFGYLSVGLSVL